MIVSIIKNNDIDYPSPDDDFSPDEFYPEYHFNHVSTKPNKVYKAIRDCLAQAGLDAENFGTALWNPLRGLVPEGGSVFVLCNFVYHKLNNETEISFNAKCTHGSIIRAIIDYLLLAVGNKGTIRFGNAPLQSCNWEQVLKDTHAERVVKFYSKYLKKGSAVVATDLRYEISERDSLGRIQKQVYSNFKDNCVEVDLGTFSYLEPLYGGERPKFRVSDYDHVRMETCHDKGKHVYIVNRHVIDADLVFSVPKLKTHEKVGMTCGLKGCVGSISCKDCLAHHRFGYPGIGGDEYPQEFLFLKKLSEFHDYVNSLGKSKYSNLLRVADKLSRAAVRRFGFNQAGNWHGNDTAWRMTLDIARIIKYADKNGNLLPKEVRRHLVLTDGVIGGAGNGPLSPCPVRGCVLSFSDNIAVGDYVNALIMGFDPNRIPLLFNAFCDSNYSLSSISDLGGKAIYNGNQVLISDIAKEMNLHFAASKGWRGKIELQ